jgi:hypothetical protein
MSSSVEPRQDSASMPVTTTRRRFDGRSMRLGSSAQAGGGERAESRGRRDRCNRIGRYFAQKS